MYIIQNAEGRLFTGFLEPCWVNPPANPLGISHAWVINEADVHHVVSLLTKGGHTVRRIPIPGKGESQCNEAELVALREQVVALTERLTKPEPRVWQMPEGAKLGFNIRCVTGCPEYITYETRDPALGKWYVGVNTSQSLKLYGATARYEGEGRWYLGTGARIDLYQYDYLQELA